MIFKIIIVIIIRFGSQRTAPESLFAAPGGQMGPAMCKINAILALQFWIIFNSAFRFMFFLVFVNWRENILWGKVNRSIYIWSLQSVYHNKVLSRPHLLRTSLLDIWFRITPGSGPLRIISARDWTSISCKQVQLFCHYFLYFGILKHSILHLFTC